MAGLPEFNDDHNCFVCGRENLAGLRLEFRACEAGQGVEAEVVFPAHLQGWRGTVHGGLLATVLDEVMIKAASAIGSKCVSAEITVRYKKPAATLVPYVLSGRVLGTHGRIVATEGRLCDTAGQIYALATGKLLQVE